jgi:3-methyladenine DNA glycosylase/8-oxoguanine DNA glycosylase
VADVLRTALEGPKGEPVDFARTIASHGVAELPPNELGLEERTLVTTLPVGGSARTVRLTTADGELRLEVVAGRVGARTRETLSATVSHMFRLDEDLSAFYELVSDDPGLDWSALGAGRMLRAPTVFEDVVNTT